MKWIAFKDQMPGVGDAYIPIMVWHNYHQIAVPAMYRPILGSNKYFLHILGEYIDKRGADPDFTHWMPIDLPKEGPEKE
jgi:hypothetical protein